MNTWGLAGQEKRRDVFKWLRDKRLSIYCLQDVHFVKKYERIIQAEWGYQCVFSSYRSGSRGTAILFNNNFEFTLHRTKSDENGNFTVIDIETEKLRFTLVNLYGPNIDTPDFYREIEHIIEDFDNASVVICGDWNLVQSFSLDTSNYKKTKQSQSKRGGVEYVQRV